MMVVVEKEFDSCSCEARLIWSDDTCLFSGNERQPLRFHSTTVMDDYHKLRVRHFATRLRFVALTQFTGVAPISATVFPNNTNRVTPIRGCIMSAANLCTSFLLYNVCQIGFPSVLRVLSSLAFSSLPTNKLSIQEPAVALIASILGGFGVVALFCSVGVYV